MSAPVDEVMQLQLDYLAKSAIQSTLATVAVVVTVHENTVASAIAGRSSGAKHEEAERFNDALKALTTTADAMMQKSTNQEYKLLILGPNGVVPVSEDVLANATIVQKRG